MSRRSGEGGRETALRALAEGLTELPRAVGALPQERLAQEPSDGSWSARTVLGHLADSEQVYGIRLRMILTADRPPLPGYDQEAWAARFSGLEDVQESLQRWSVLRRATLRLLETLTEEEWSRVGLHGERGEESVERVVILLAGHDRAHLDQMVEAARA